MSLNESKMVENTNTTESWKITWEQDGKTEHEVYGTREEAIQHAQDRVDEDMDPPEFKLFKVTEVEYEMPDLTPTDEDSYAADEADEA